MLKPLFLILTYCFIVSTVQGQKSDTTIVYFKNNLNGYHRVSSLDSADFFRVILPPDSGDSRANVTQFYKNVKIKFVGKYDPINATIGVASLTGDCISYYPDGKKASICHYTRNQKDGNEYLFYPNGAIYCYKKHSSEVGIYSIPKEDYPRETKNLEATI